MNLNKQQRDINNPNIRNKNIIVPASAGTGKTTTMTTRIIEYIKEGKDINNYLVVSFTEAAASELKERIAKGLKDNLDNISNKEKKHYNEQLAKLPLANISTIHSLCLDIIKRYGYILNIDPDIAGNLGNEAILNELKYQAISKSLNYDKHNELIYILNDRSEDKNNLEKIIIQLDNFIQNIENYNDWKEKVLNYYDNFKNNNFDSFPIDINNYLNEKLNKLDESFRIQKDIINRFTKKDGAAQNAFNNFEPIFKQLLKDAKGYLNKKDYKNFSKLFNELDNYPRATAISDDYASKERKYQKEKVFDKIIKELKEYYYFEETLNKTGDYIKTILEITEDYRNNYNLLKESHNIIDYQDMLTKALEILEKNDYMIGKIYRNKFTEIMVDEYQDTNQLQENIIRTIAKGNNVFRVGDIKQSIYKFQNAKPKLMKLLIKNKNKDDEVLPLQYNYRCSFNIRELSNYIFNKLMNLNENNYNKETDDLSFDPETELKDRIGHKVKLITVPFDKERDDKPNERRTLSAKEKANNICEYIGNEICRLKKEENLKWSDFVILVRNNTYKPLLKRILNNHNVPVYTKTKTGFFKDNAVSSVIALLNLILNNNQQDAFNVLTGPMFLMPYDDIVNNKEILNLKDKEIKNKEISKKKDLFLNLIKDLRKYKEEYSLSELLNYIYEYNDFYIEKVNIFERGNLDSLFKMVLDFEKDDNNIKNLVSYLSSFKTVDREEANTFNSKDDIVQIMTIHQSKGTEFGYVFVADFFNRYSESKYDGQIQYHEDYGIALKYTSPEYKIKYPSAYYSLIKKYNQYEEFEEELRILYVAMTRAKEALYIVNAYASDDLCELNNNDLYKTGMMNWIDRALDKCPDRIKDLYEREILNQEYLNKMNYVSDKTDEKDFLFDKYSDELIELNILDYSPSQLEDRFINNLNFDIEAGARRGSIMHKAIELLKIKDIKIDDIDKLNINLDKNDKDKIISFYNNEFTKSLINNINYHERTFIYEDENGLIDLLSIGNEEVYIIDFKSDKNTNEEKLINRYQSQLNAYYKVVNNYYKDKITKMFIYSFDLNKYIEIPKLN